MSWRLSVRRPSIKVAPGVRLRWSPTRRSEAPRKVSPAPYMMRTADDLTAMQEAVWEIGFVMSTETGLSSANYQRLSQAQNALYARLRG